MIIGICGFIGSGKSVAGDYLVKNYGFTPLAFASTLKDATSVIFGWDRKLLEGDTSESREFREVKDEFWSKRLGWEVTPRKILQQMGTEVMRESFDDNIWLHSLERKIKPGTNYVITDTRFPNEINFIKDLDGKVIRVVRGPEPEWYNEASSYVEEFVTKEWSDTPFPAKYPHVHISEYAWINTNFDRVLYNDRLLTDLYQEIDMMLVDFRT